jgi:hypothetical protein
VASFVLITVSLVLKEADGKSFSFFLFSKEAKSLKVYGAIFLFCWWWGGWARGARRRETEKGFYEFK